MEQENTVIEIDGIKLEVDLRTAKRIDTFKIGSKVKLLVKGSYGEPEVKSGVVVGFEPFDSLPTIIVAYLDVSYSEAKLEFASINSKSGEKFEIVMSIDDTLPVQKGDVLTKMDREIEKKKEEISDLNKKREYFLRHFNQWFEPESA